MIVGVGVDMVVIERMAQALQRTPRIARRLLADAEWLEFEQVKDPARFLAKRFAVKEAVLKALGTGLAQGISWQEICVQKTAAGQPYVTLQGQAARQAESLGIQHWHVSYSDEKAQVVALAIAEK
ncbi:holo-ACP synthase [Nitrincola tapanii]|uniref:Holo-[acyl-carrier-protein] synthase n=1 Tax=Nitrincola tapanii TaxID=1708751 RepID=A0A5A9W0T4_9GAMM|nr:holo-ACP synthase [Nitrincola tapanii]KAA0873829.1 holo-ACP synthase [Nitrincola tapanii]